MFGRDLVVMTDYDPNKTVEELEFFSIPIWVRVLKLPFGMMKKATGEVIGKEIGVLLEVEADDDSLAVGRFLRIKIRLDIRQPLMRGVTVFAGENKKPLWCPLEYEFLPDFCYICGIIGHTDKFCEKQLKKGEVQQYNKSLRCIPDRRSREDGSGDRYFGGRSVGPWRSGGSGSRGSFGGSSNKSHSGRAGSDGPTWRKEVALVGEKKEEKKKNSEEEVTSPLKQTEGQHDSGLGVSPSRSRKVLNFGTDNVQQSDERTEVTDNQITAPLGDAREVPGIYDQHVNSALQAMHVDPGQAVEGDGGLEATADAEGVGKERAPKRGRYKKIARNTSSMEVAANSAIEGRKRSLSNEEVGSKKMRMSVDDNVAGLSEQPCENQ